MSGRLNIADLFCGAGGTSLGALEAAAALGYEARLTNKLRHSAPAEDSDNIKIV